MENTWTEPKTNWNNSNLPVLSDFDRMEKNTLYLQELLG